LVLRHKTPDLRFQDLKIGDMFEVGEYLMSRERVHTFASQYDSQPFHLSDEGTKGHPIFERMAASGWHTVIAMQNLIADFWKGTKLRGLAGSGVDRIRWQAPVYVDETLRCVLEIADIKPSVSKADRAYITMQVSMLNGAGKHACDMALTGVFLVDDQDKE
jgi:acyl dehydratase